MAISSIDNANQNFVQGKGYLQPITSLVSGSTTNMAAASGFLSFSISPNAIGSTLPGTIVSIPRSANTSDAIRLLSLLNNGNGSVCGFLANIYRIGTLNLAATGDRFTHDAATFPLTRTRLGQTTNIPLTPILQITTATTTTPAQLRLRTNAGAAGYTDQDGNAIVGAKVFTMPNASTATNTGAHLPIENVDSAVLDISAIEVTVAASAGAATIWGLEVISPLGSMDIALTGMHDAITSGLTMQNLQPAAATSGSVTSHLVAILSTTSSRNIFGFIGGVLDV